MGADLSFMVWFQIYVASLTVGFSSAYVSEEGIFILVYVFHPTLLL